MKLNTKIRILLATLTLSGLIVVNTASISNSYAATTAEVEDWLDVTILTTAEIDIKTANSVVLSKMSRQTFFDTEHISNMQVTTTGLRMTIKSELSMTSDVDEASIDPAVEVMDDVSSWQL
ncbi:MAG: hypothetical protein HZR80_07395, partial [Candidatus Heimdallarchaeota archaeon]